MASSIYFNGRRTVTPSVVSKVDADGLNVVSLSAVGIVAVLGTAEGGLPVSSMSDKNDIPRFRNAQAARNAFRGGQLHEVGNMLFRPSNDTDVQGGAVEFVALKTNPATKSEATLVNGAGDAMKLLSKDYGAFTEQISFDMQDGTNKGKLIVIELEDVRESYDNVGGDPLATLIYVPGSNGYTTMTAEVAANGDIAARATKVLVGGDGDLDNPITAVAAEVVSSDAGDTTQTVELFGLVGGVPTIEEFTLNGTTPVTGSIVWAAGDLLGARVTGTTLGAVTVRELGGGGVDVFTLPLGTDQELGMATCTECYVADEVINLVSSGASTKDIIVYGIDKVGSVISEKITLTGAVALPSVSTAFSQITAIVTGDMEAAQSLTVSANAVLTTAAVQSTLSKVGNYFNARNTVVSSVLTEGFTFTMTSGQVALSPDNLDVQAATSVLSALDLTADFYVLVTTLNNNSSLVAASISTGATALPDNTPAPVFLAGGIEGVPLFEHAQAALDLLKEIRVNTIVDLSGSAAVAAAIDAHCAWAGGAGRSERDGVVGVLNAAGNDVPTKTELKAAAVNLNSRHVRVVGQAVTKFNVKGEVVEFLPPYFAAIIAAMQAGSDIGEPLTHKTFIASSIRSDSSWAPAVDSEEMIDAGILIAEDQDGIGRRVVRNVTSYLTDDNLAFVEASTNEALNIAMFEFRGALEFAVGQKGFSGTKSSIRVEAKAILALLVSRGIIVAWENLEIAVEADAFPVSVSIAPISPTNFIPITAHLISSAQFLN